MRHRSSIAESAVFAYHLVLSYQVGVASVGEGSHELMYEINGLILYDSIHLLVQDVSHNSSMR